MHVVKKRLNAKNTKEERNYHMKISKAEKNSPNKVNLKQSNL